MMFVKLYVLENMHCLKLYRQEEILVFLPFLQDRFLGNLPVGGIKLIKDL